MKKFKDKVCLVIGASTGIGKELTIELLARGAIVIATSRMVETLEKNLTLTKEAFPDRLFFKEADVLNSKDIADLFKSIEGEQKVIDHCFNCVGLCFFKNYMEVLDDEVKKVLDTNLIGTINTSHAAIKHFLHNKNTQQKYFIQIGSFAGAIPGHKKFSLYAAAKEAQAGLLRSLQAEFSDENIHFILVTPAGVNTGIHQNTLGDPDALKEKLASSTLDSANQVAKGILENLYNELEDYGIRLFPTQLARETYRKFYEQR